jgi:hypothetical protein
MHLQVKNGHGFSLGQVGDVRRLGAGITTML